ncbi:MAG: MerR family transcriptional regulator [Azospirillaceae bacterium]
MVVTDCRMKIGELARRADVSHRTIHFYENRGLLAPAERQGAGYRYYDEEALARLRKIQQLKRIGLSLEEIAEVIDLYFADDSGAKGKRRVLEILEGHLRDTDARIADLVEFRADLKANIDRVRALLR